MEGNNSTVVLPPCSNNISPEITRAGSVVGEGRRLCPLCQSEIRLFFINFNEKMLMCENTECEFPFGHEELQFVKEDNEIEHDEELSTIRTHFGDDPSGFTYSVGSTTAMCDIDKINRVCDTDDNQFELKTFEPAEVEKRRQFLLQKEQEILQHIQDIKNLNDELTNINTTQSTVGVQIKNEKWIKNLKNIQEMTGFQLLKPEEIKLLKKEEPVLGLGELKIDIDPSNDFMSTIKIEIHNRLNKEKQVEDET